MSDVQIRNTRVPVLGLGTWQMQDQECEDAVRESLELGYRHVDTAQMYENEERVGAGLRASGVPREEVFLTTKVWRDNLESKAVERTTRESLERLGVEHVDLLLVHWPHDEVPLSETLQAMTELQEAGLTRAIGVSNFNATQLEEAVGLAPIVCNQIEFHPYLGQDRQLELAKKHELFITAYCPLARGRVPKDGTLQRIGKRHGRSAAQVGLRWLIQMGAVVIPKAASPEHRKSNLQVLEFELSPQDMAEIAGLERGERLIDPEFAPDWSR